jgi:Tol biopolymer transport system component
MHGSLIAFCSYRNSTADRFVINAENGSEARLTENSKVNFYQVLAQTVNQCNRDELVFDMQQKTPACFLNLPWKRRLW